VTFNCRPSGGNPAQRFRSPDGEQNRKIFVSLIEKNLRVAIKIMFRKFFCFAFLLTQELWKRFSTPFRLLGFRPEIFGGRAIIFLVALAPPHSCAGDTKVLPDKICCIKIDFMLVYK